MAQIVLTPAETQQLINQLASRDPVLSFLIQKQQEAAKRVPPQMPEPPASAVALPPKAEPTQ